MNYKKHIVHIHILILDNIPHISFFLCNSLLHVAVHQKFLTTNLPQPSPQPQHRQPHRQQRRRLILQPIRVTATQETTHGMTEHIRAVTRVITTITAIITMITVPMITVTADMITAMRTAPIRASNFSAEFSV